MEQVLGQKKHWIYRAVSLLSFNGGFVNMVTFISFLHNPVGYVTGTLTFAADAFADGNFKLFYDMLLALLFFLGGAVLSGLITPKDSFERGNNYNLVIALEIFCLLAGSFGLRSGVDSAKYFLAAAMGVQNALSSHYGRSIIRTTHMTGTMTDFGILIAKKISGQNIDNWRLIINTLLLVSFFWGGVVAVFLYKWFDYDALLFSVVLCFLMLKFQWTRKFLYFLLQKYPQLKFIKFGR